MRAGIHSLCALAAAALLALPACVEPVTLAEEPPTSPLAAGESREVTLHFLRLDVTDFGQRLTPADLRRLPASLLEETWLLDLEIEPLLRNALGAFTATSPDAAADLPRPAYNLWRLFNMTPNNAVLDGTELEGLLGVGEAVGFPPGKILADLVQIDENDRLVSTEVAARAVLDDVVNTHPNVHVRRGPVTPEHPDGLYPVAPDSMAVSLADVAADFTNLPARFGPAPLDPADPGGAEHPGFISGAKGLVTRGELAIVVRVSLNALPYRGVELANASVATVNSTLGQAEGLVDTSDPGWLSVEGLPEEVALREVSMVVRENPSFIAGGASKDPAPLGDSAVWSLPPWEFERVIADAARLGAEGIAPHCTAYAPMGNNPDPLEAVNVCIDAAKWTEIQVHPSVVLDAPPPEPSYFWDVLLEVAQARLHDGAIPEGKGDIALTIQNVPVGMKTSELEARIRDTLQSDTATLARLAARLNDVAEGDADFFYYVPTDESPPDLQGDWLYFVLPEDLREDAEGAPVRPYSYAKPGFFADPALTEKVSSTVAIDGDDRHEKVRIPPGTTVYVEDAKGRRFSIRAGEKPSPRRIALTVTRIQ